MTDFFQVMLLLVESGSSKKSWSLLPHPTLSIYILLTDMAEYHPNNLQWKSGPNSGISDGSLVAGDCSMRLQL